MKIFAGVVLAGAALVLVSANAEAACPPSGPVGDLCRRVEALEARAAGQEQTIAALSAEVGAHALRVAALEAALLAAEQREAAQDQQIQSLLAGGGGGGQCGAGQSPVCCPTGETFCPTLGCTDLAHSATSCGACGAACDAGMSCRDGACVFACSGDGPDPTCAPRGDTCDAASGTCGCGSGGVCERGFQCDGGACVRCGGTPASAGDSCLDLLTRCPGVEDGTYWLTTPAGAPFEAYCDMAGGGWTLLGKQVANMSWDECTGEWTDGAPGRLSPYPLPGSNSGITTRFPFPVWNAIAATDPAGAYKVTSDYPSSYVSYWRASCLIDDWDSGTPECFQDFADEGFTSPRRASTHNPGHGVLQGYGGNGGFSDAFLTYTSFQQCVNTPAVGYHDSAGNWQGYNHNAGLMIWFR